MNSGVNDILISHNSTLNNRKDEKSMIDKKAFLSDSKWLLVSVIPPESQPMTLVEAFKLGFARPTEKIDLEIIALKKKQMELGGQDPVFEDVTEISDRFKDAKPSHQEDIALFKWFCISCPKKNFSHEIQKHLLTLMENTDVVHTRDRVKSLREFFFAKATVEGGALFWGKIINQAYENGEKVCPVACMTRESTPKVKKTLSLMKEGTTDLKEKTWEIMIEDYFKLLSANLADKLGTRIRSYMETFQWLAGFTAWKQQKTRSELLYYETRNKRGNPWGDQIYLEHVLRIRRILESWTLIAPNIVNPLDPDTITEENIKEMLIDDPEHPLRCHPDIIKWFLSVNRRAWDTNKKKLKGGKKRNTTEDAQQNYQASVEHVTFHNRWVSHESKSYTFLEVIEIAENKNSHLIPPTYNVKDYQTAFKKLLVQYENTSDFIEGFPETKGFTDQSVDRLLGNRKCNATQAKALGTLLKIFNNQRNISKKTEYEEVKESMSVANRPLPNYEEWNSLTATLDENSKTSWMTGRTLAVGEYQMVYVEATNDPYYRKTLRVRNKAKKEIFGVTDKIEAVYADSEEEDKEDCTGKCSVCGIDDLESNMEKIFMHHTHKKNFRAWASRNTAKESLAESRTEDPLETLQKRYRSLITTIGRWSEAKEEEAPAILQKMKEFTKRRKLSSNSDCSDIMSPPSTPRTPCLSP